MAGMINEITCHAFHYESIDSALILVIRINRNDIVFYHRKYDRKAFPKITEIIKEGFAIHNKTIGDIHDMGFPERLKVGIIIAIPCVKALNECVKVFDVVVLAECFILIF